MRIWRELAAWSPQAPIDFCTHLRTGVPVTLATLAIAAGWLLALGPAS